MEEADLEFRITPGDGEVPLLQHLLHSQAALDCCQMMCCHVDLTPPPHDPLPRTNTYNPFPLTCSRTEDTLGKGLYSTYTVHVLG